MWQDGTAYLYAPLHDPCLTCQNNIQVSAMSSIMRINYMATRKMANGCSNFGILITLKQFAKLLRQCQLQCNNTQWRNKLSNTNAYIPKISFIFTKRRLELVTNVTNTPSTVLSWAQGSHWIWQLGIIWTPRLFKQGVNWTFGGHL